MTTHIFFENATLYDYNIVDKDNIKFGHIPSNGYVSIKLNFSPSFDKKYTLKSKHNSFKFSLNINGQIKQLFPNNKVHLEVKSQAYNTRTQIFPPPVKTSDTIPICCHLPSLTNNKLLITPFDNIYARTTPIVAPFVPDKTLRLDFM